MGGSALAMFHAFKEAWFIRSQDLQAESFQALPSPGRFERRRGPCPSYEEKTTDWPKCCAADMGDLSGLGHLSLGGYVDADEQPTPSSRCLHQGVLVEDCLDGRRQQYGSLKKSGGNRNQKY